MLIILVCVVIAGVAFLVISLRSKAAASECLETIALIDGAKQTWALESDSGPEAKPTWDDIYAYTGGFAGDGRTYPFRCPSGGIYVIGESAHPATCSVHGFLVCVFEQLSEHEAKGVPGAVVETLCSDGHKVKTRTDAGGRALVKAPPNQTAMVIISKPGYITVSNPIASLYSNISVALERVRK